MEEVIVVLTEKNEFQYRDESIYVALTNFFQAQDFEVLIKFVFWVLECFSMNYSRYRFVGVFRSSIHVFCETTICYFCVGSQIPFIRKLQFCQKLFRSLLFKNKNVLTRPANIKKKICRLGFQLFASGFLTAVTPTLVFAQDTNCAATESPRHSNQEKEKNAD